jgi:hypothetical protein
MPDTRPLSTDEDPVSTTGLTPPPALETGTEPLPNDPLPNDPPVKEPPVKDPPPPPKGEAPTTPPIRLATAFKMLATDPKTSPGRRALTIST